MNVDRQRLAAVRTMEALGYTYEGGERWKPPLGPSSGRIFDLEHVLFLVEGFLRVGRFDKTNVDALTNIVGHALRKSEQR